MGKPQYNKVYSLISTLSKAEKKYFRLFATRNQSSGNLFFLDVFDIYDQYGMVDDDFIGKKLQTIKINQLANIRSHLYTQLLTSLRLQYQKKNADIDIRQKIDFAKILYNKGLYRHALDILAKAKKISLEQHRNILVLEILFFEKAIESQNITKSIGSRATELIDESTKTNKKINQILNYSNLDLELYAYYLSNGFCQSKNELQQIEDKFLHRLAKDDKKQLDFYSSLYYNQSLCWYSYIRQDFNQYHQAAKDWVNLFEQQPEMITNRPAFYLKGIHNVINSSFILFKTNDFHYFMQMLLQFGESINTTWNEEGMLTLYKMMHELDLCFLTGEFSSYKSGQQLVELLEKNPFHWDQHRLAVFYYKLGCLYFGQNKYSEASDYFRLVTSFYLNHSDSMVFLFAKILFAFSHFKMNDIKLVDSLVQALQKDINKNKKNNSLERELVGLLSQLLYAKKSELKSIYTQSLARLKQLRKEPLTAIQFLHFFAIEWVEAMIENREAQDILRKKYDTNHTNSSIFVN